MYQIRPPSELKLTGNISESWKSFDQRFSLYMQAVGADDKSDKQKIAIFLTVAGQEALEVYNTLTFTGTDKEKYDKVITKFKDYCTPQQNETYERFKFHSRKQKEGERIEQFVTDLRLQSQSCNFGELKDSLIRDQIIIGVRDHGVRENLLKNSVHGSNTLKNNTKLSSS